MPELPDDEFVTLSWCTIPPRSQSDPAGSTTSSDGTEDFWTTWLIDPDGYRIELVQ